MNNKLVVQPVLVSPIPLNRDDIREFQEMYYNEFGIKIDAAEARNKATFLLVATKAVFKPIPDLKTEKLRINRSNYTKEGAIISTR